MTAMTTSTPERVFNARQVAQHLGCDEGTVYRLIRDGEMRCTRVGRLIRVPESALAEFINGGGSN